jgi:hypothetical protein
MPQNLYIISLIISCLALLISVLTFWFTLFRKGRLLMTQPTIIFLGPDGKAFESNNNKIYIRTLLYSTAKRGHVVESLHILTVNINISDSQALKLEEPNSGIFFDWSPDQQNYHSHIDTKPIVESELEKLIELMNNTKNNVP